MAEPCCRSAGRWPLRAALRGRERAIGPSRHRGPLREGKGRERAIHGDFLLRLLHLRRLLPLLDLSPALAMVAPRLVRRAVFLRRRLHLVIMLHLRSALLLRLARPVHSQVLMRVLLPLMPLRSLRHRVPARPVVLPRRRL